MVQLDRVTGNIRYFDEGIEETISLSVIGPDGSYYQGLSPLIHNMVKGTLVYFNDFLSDGLKNKLQDIHDNSFKFLNLKNSRDLEFSLANLFNFLEKLN